MAGRGQVWPGLKEGSYLISLLRARAKLAAVPGKGSDGDPQGTSHIAAASAQRVEGEGSLKRQEGMWEGEEEHRLLTERLCLLG